MSNEAAYSTATDRFDTIIKKLDAVPGKSHGVSWLQLILMVVTIISFVLLGVLYIIRSENAPIKIDITHMKGDIKEIREACKPIKSEDELAFFIDSRIRAHKKD